jgi:hypothetical protein
MDDALMRFRRAADRENRGRPLRRRYSPGLQQQAVAYWHQQGRGQGVRTMVSFRQACVGARRPMPDGYAVAAAATGSAS